MKSLLLFPLLIEFVISLHVCAQDSSFVLSTQNLNPYTPAYIGNGNFSLTTSRLGTNAVESYLAWVYDKGEGDIPRIAALPSWNEINFSNGSHWLNEIIPDSGSMRSFRQTLNMYDGLLSTGYEWNDGDRSTTVDVESFVSRSNKNLAVVKCTITPRFSGIVKVEFPLRAWSA